MVQSTWEAPPPTPQIPEVLMKDKVTHPRECGRRSLPHSQTYKTRDSLTRTWELVYSPTNPLETSVDPDYTVSFTGLESSDPSLGVSTPSSPVPRRVRLV